MPFRIPDRYKTFSCLDQDRSAEEIAAWINWLRQELATALVAYEATAGVALEPPPKSESNPRTD